jgi:AcrR family transcriptional regulator
MAPSSTASSPAFPAQQVRSRATLERLLHATEAVLDEHGLEGATVPRIAKRAKLSPASIYRRFPDKDALLRYVCLKFFEDKIANFAAAEVAPVMPGITLEMLVRKLVGVLSCAYTARRGLMRALVQFTYQHPDLPFREKMKDAQAQTFAAMTSMFLRFRDDIRHPDPELAVRLGLLTVAVTLREMLLVAYDDRWNKIVRLSDEQLHEQLSQMLLHYLTARR